MIESLRKLCKDTKVKFKMLGECMIIGKVNVGDFIWNGLIISGLWEVCFGLLWRGIRGS